MYIDFNPEQLGNTFQVVWYIWIRKETVCRGRLGAVAMATPQWRRPRTPTQPKIARVWLGYELTLGATTSYRVWAIHQCDLYSNCLLNQSKILLSAYIFNYIELCVILKMSWRGISYWMLWREVIKLVECCLFTSSTLP